MEPAAVAETHISVLFFYGDRVFKVRKPVTTPFLDFSTRQLRLADCRREVDLNRRLAPDVYLGVVDIVDEAGRPMDHMVAMRRLPPERRLARLAADPALDPAELVAVARQLASFHSRAERSPQIDAAGSVEHLAMLWSTNLAETGPYAGRFIDGASLNTVGDRAMGYLRGRHPLLRRRVAEGRIVDGHGDLLAQDIFCLDDGPRILDCIEFDPRFRWGDVLYDTAFLAMDLEHLGRPDLARGFLDSYREFSGETHPMSLEHWYIAYRALVRTKIACLRAEGGDPGAAAEAARLLALALRRSADAEVHLVLLGGLPGTGKSTVAGGLADRLGWQVLRSDEVRKDLAGLGHAAPAGAAPFAGIYTPDFSERAYGELLRRAGSALQYGESVILDATWLDPQQRAAARSLAGQAGATLHELCCDLPVDVAAERLLARGAAGGDASDATPQVLASMARRTVSPWSGAHRIDTAGTAEHAVERAALIVRPDLAP